MGIGQFFHLLSDDCQLDIDNMCCWFVPGHHVWYSCNCLTPISTDFLNNLAVRFVKVSMLMKINVNLIGGKETKPTIRTIWTFDNQWDETTLLLVGIMRFQFAVATFFVRVRHANKNKL